ncbi:HNH endonuclease [Halobacterium rubrum]|uniref:HNH endonuclease n=1 Tax=Halobacterium TaxID=2239 RepID=UPI001F455B40|nr:MULTISPECIES: HNH endonuclease [Halobacterium]MDH5021686.1 HNH endonuclease [Halobacterium rubrum]
MSEASRYGPEWDSLAAEVRKRDDWTCQRCGEKSGPHADEDGRILDVHHITWKSRGGGDEKENLVTLCRPCHGVQHPDNENFDQHRTRARIYPSPEAQSSVAFVNTDTEGETIYEFFQGLRDRCRRCNHTPNDGNSLLVYPNFDSSKLNGTPPGEKCVPLCEPCAGLVLDNDDETPREALRTTENSRAPQNITTRTEEAQISGTWKGAKLGVTREAVNRKEWVLFKSPYRFVHFFWRTLGTLGIFLGLSYLSIRNLSRVSPWLSSIDPLSTIGWESWMTRTLLLVVAMLLAYTIRWSVAGVTQWVWRQFDGSIEPHHFEKDVWDVYRWKITYRLKWIGVPYAGLLALSALV